MEYMWVTFCRFLVENFCVDSRSKSLPLEAIGISRIFKQIGQVRRIQASLLKTGDGQPSFFTLVQMRGQFSLRSVGLPCDTLILVCIMTWLIVRLLEGKHSVRFFSFNLFISASNISAPKPPKCPHLNPIVQLVFRKKQAQHNFHWRQFCVTKSTLIKKSKSSINFVRHFLDKQRNVLKIIDVRVLI